MMERKPVSSSNLASVGYDPETNTLEVLFHSGGLYQYFGVPPQIYQGLMTAGSKGSYLYNHIKGRYRYKKLR